jgi:hypothetical protein
MINLLGYEGDTIRGTVNIRSSEGTAFRITEVSSAIDDKIAYKLETVEKGKEYRLNVSRRSEQSESFQGKIVLKTNSEKKPEMVLTVNGIVKESVTARPSTLSFGTIDTRKEKSEWNLRRHLEVVNLRGKERMEIKKIIPSVAWISVEAAPQKEGDTYSLFLTLDETQLPRGRFEETIEIRTNCSTTSMLVRVRGEVL